MYHSLTSTKRCACAGIWLILHSPALSSILLSLPNNIINVVVVFSRTLDEQTPHQYWSANFIFSAHHIIITMASRTPILLASSLGTRCHSVLPLQVSYGGIPYSKHQSDAYMICHTAPPSLCENAGEAAPITHHWHLTNLSCLLQSRQHHSQGPRCI